MVDTDALASLVLDHLRTDEGVVQMVVALSDAGLTVESLRRCRDVDELAEDKNEPYWILTFKTARDD